MFDNFSGRVTDSLVHNQITKIEDWDIYCYGAQQGLVVILIFAITLPIFFVWDAHGSDNLHGFYIPLRHYAGGFYANTPARCYAPFCLLIIDSLKSLLMLIMLSFLISAACSIMTFHMMISKETVSMIRQE